MPSFFIYLYTLYSQYLLSSPFYDSPSTSSTTTTQASPISSISYILLYTLNLLLFTLYSYSTSFSLNPITTSTLSNYSISYYSFVYSTSFLNLLLTLFILLIPLLIPYTHLTLIYSYSHIIYIHHFLLLYSHHSLHTPNCLLPEFLHFYYSFPHPFNFLLLLYLSY